MPRGPWASGSVGPGRGSDGKRDCTRWKMFGFEEDHGMEKIAVVAGNSSRLIHKSKNTTATSCRPPRSEGLVRVGIPSSWRLGKPDRSNRREGRLLATCTLTNNTLDSIATAYTRKIVRNSIDY